LFRVAAKHTHTSSQMTLLKDGGDPYIKPNDSAKGWWGSFFYQADQAPPERNFGLRSFVNGPAQEQDSWGTMDDSSMDNECQLYSRRISKLVFAGLTGADTIHCWIS
jgi:hypothetical protein